MLAPQDKVRGRGWWASCLAGLLFLVLSLLSIPAHAVQPDEMLKDPGLESRARALSRGLRCLVCQNQSIDDSDATLAHDLRVLLRERLTAGDSDQQAVNFIVARYGNFVLLKPPLQWNTLLLWFSPLVLLGLAGAGFWGFLSRQQTTPPAPPLSQQDQARLAQLLQDGPDQ